MSKGFVAQRRSVCESHLYFVGLRDARLPELFRIMVCTEALCWVVGFAENPCTDAAVYSLPGQRAY